jgi:hypothetical protein
MRSGSKLPQTGNRLAKTAPPAPAGATERSISVQCRLSQARVLVRCISAAIAALAGALTGMLYHYAVGTYFSSFNSLELVAIVVIIAVGDPWYAVVAAGACEVLPAYVPGGTILHLAHDSLRR